MDDNLRKEISDRIKVLRNNKGLTQEDAAEKVGLTYNSYVKMENAYNFPSLKVLIKLSEIYNVPIDLIVFGNVDRAKADISEYDKIHNFLKLCNPEKLGYTNKIIESLLEMIHQK